MLVITIISFYTVLAGVLLFLVIYMLFSDVKFTLASCYLFRLIGGYSIYINIYMLVKEKKRENYLMVLGFLIIIGYSLKSHTIIIGIGIYI